MVGTELYIILGIVFSPVAFWLWNRGIKENKELKRWRWLYGNKSDGRKNSKERKNQSI